MTIVGVVLRFHPVFRSFVKAVSPMRRQSIRISQRLQDEILEPVEKGDPTAAVAEYKFDWWNKDPEAAYNNMEQFEEAFIYHAERVRSPAPSL